MGMFDYLRCDVPLPDGFTGVKLFQTKDFDCEMTIHVISKEGRMLVDRGYWDSAARRRVERLEDANFHGYVNFYGVDESKKRAVDGWHEYSAKFTDGQLVAIERLKREGW